MNCKQAERLILLAGSGELSARNHDRLERHVAVCARCTAYGEDADRIIKTAGRELSLGEPDASALATIRLAADKEMRRCRGEKSVNGRPVVSQRRLLLAIAATLLICASILYLLSDRTLPSRKTAALYPSGTISGEEQVQPSDFLHDLTIIAWGDETYIERISDLSRLPDVSLVEQELMILEGLAI